MKFRHYLLILGGVLLSVLLFGIGAVIRSQPVHYGFLDNEKAKRTSLEPDPIGLIGRESRFYVIHKSFAKIDDRAKRELEPKGWKETATNPSLFTRSKHEHIEIWPANNYMDTQLLAGIAKADLANYTVVKVIDPHMAPAIKQRFARWTHHPIRSLRVNLARHRQTNSHGYTI